MEDGGLLGPYYSFGDQLPTPSELGIHRSGWVPDVLRAAGGINYYVDAIGFGESTTFSRELVGNQRPLGLRFFIKTGQQCSNGADMYEYVNTVPSGMPGVVGEKVKGTLGVDLRGMAPGIMEDAAEAMNPLPIFKATMESGYAKCKQVTLPVGDEYGRISSPFDASDVWIKDPAFPKNVGNGEHKGVSGGSKPHQTRWVFDQSISMEEYNATPKTEGTKGVTEGFLATPSSHSQITAGLLFTLLVFGVVAIVHTK
jgi:hypothetical protein